MKYVPTGERSKPEALYSLYKYEHNSVFKHIPVLKQGFITTHWLLIRLVREARQNNSRTGWTFILYILSNLNHFRRHTNNRRAIGNIVNDDRICSDNRVVCNTNASQNPCARPDEDIIPDIRKRPLIPHSNCNRVKNRTIITDALRVNRAANGVSNIKPTPDLDIGLNFQAKTMETHLIHQTRRKRHAFLIQPRSQTKP